jgi:uncharacterized membrane protein
LQAVEVVTDRHCTNKHHHNYKHNTQTIKIICTGISMFLIILILILIVVIIVVVIIVVIIIVVIIIIIIIIIIPESNQWPVNQAAELPTLEQASN